MIANEQQPAAQEAPKTDWITLGLDGWIIGSISIIVAIILTVITTKFIQHAIIQRNIKTKGSVAGGSIGVRNGPAPQSVIQENIKAEGDIAGGNIYKGKE